MDKDLSDYYKKRVSDTEIATLEHEARKAAWFAKQQAQLVEKQTQTKLLNKVQYETYVQNSAGVRTIATETAQYLIDKGVETDDTLKVSRRAQHLDNTGTAFILRTIPVWHIENTEKHTIHHSGIDNDSNMHSVSWSDGWSEHIPASGTALTTAGQIIRWSGNANLIKPVKTEVLTAPTISFEEFETGGVHKIYSLEVSRWQEKLGDLVVSKLVVI